jgi:23S rRNA (uracil1939-C5)-methyltransferase
MSRRIRFDHRRPETADLVDVEIERLDVSGDGVATYRGQPLHVPFTIPGERVRVRAGASRGGIVFATLEDVLRPSPHRVVPYCPHFGPQVPQPDFSGAPAGAAAPRAEPGVGPCGGCSWQHIAYPEQLRLKTQLVTRLVRRLVAASPIARPMIAGAPVDYPWGYRHKVHFVFGTTARAGRREGALVMGHYGRGTRRVVPVRECPVHDERGNAVAFRLRDACARANIPAGAQDGPRSALKSIAIRVGHGTPETMATLVLTGEADKRLRTATRRMLDDPAAPSSFHVNIHPRGDAFIFGRETRRISGPERMREEVAGTSFLISATAFFQTNIGAAHVLVRLVLEAVPPGAPVLDLYAGAGLFALPLARAGHEVVAVEENHAAVADGEASLRLNRIPPERCRFIARPVARALSDLLRPSTTGSRRPPAAPVVVLDPPRDGCEAPVLHAVFGTMTPPAAVYISCNPEALARDLAAIVRHGYRAESIQPVDMFPHTARIETVVVLTRR